MEYIKNYLWFIRKSQSFMKGYNPYLVFFKSLYLGVGFCNDLRKDEKRMRAK